MDLLKLWGSAILLKQYLKVFKYNTNIYTYLIKTF